MKQAQICPVCNGSGKFMPLHEYNFDRQTTAIYPAQPRVCHGCNGTGWVAVEQDDTLNIGELKIT